MRPHIEKFMVLFNRLKSELNNSLKNLKWLPNEKPEIKELCYQLDDTYRLLSRNFVNNSAKSLFAPSIFQKRWDEYVGNYQKKIDEIAKPLREKYEILKHKYQELAKYTIDNKYNNLLSIIKKVPESELEHAELRFKAITDILINKNKQ